MSRKAKIVCKGILFQCTQETFAAEMRRAGQLAKSSDVDFDWHDCAQVVKKLREALYFTHFVRAKAKRPNTRTTVTFLFALIADDKFAALRDASAHISKQFSHDWDVEVSIMSEEAWHEANAKRAIPF